MLPLPVSIRIFTVHVQYIHILSKCINRHLPHPGTGFDPQRNCHRLSVRWWLLQILYLSNAHSLNDNDNDQSNDNVMVTTRTAQSTNGSNDGYRMPKKFTKSHAFLENKTLPPFLRHIPLCHWCFARKGSLYWSLWHFSIVFLGKKRGNMIYLLLSTIHCFHLWCFFVVSMIFQYT